MDLKKKLTILLIFCCGSVIAEAQEVISTSGTVLENSSGSISFTVGEAIIGTLGSGATILTQGFQQPFDLYINSTGDAMDFNCTVYPNPAEEQIRIYLEHPSGFQYKLYDMRGELIAHDQMISTETEIDFASLEPSVYILKIFKDQGEEKTFKIVKQ